MKRTGRHQRRHSLLDLKRIWSIFAILILLASMVSAFSGPAAAQPTEPAQEQPVEPPVAPPVELPTDVPQEQPTDPPMQTLPTEVPTESPMDQATEIPTEEGPVIQAVEEPGTIAVNYRLCPMGTDLAAGDPVTLSGACTVAGEGTTFGLAGSGGDLGSQVIASAPGTTAWMSVPVGAASLTQFSPPAGGIAVFCEGNSPNGNTKPYARAFVTGGASVSLDVLESEQITCDWYAGQTEANSTVTVYKWDCLAETMYGEDPTYYGAECATEHLNIPFTLTDSTGAHPVMTQANGTQWDNVVPDAMGRVTITETIPEGYGDPVVFCQTLDDAAPTLMMSQGGVVTIQPAANTPFDYQCFWYNIPSDGGTVTVYKWDCMPDTMYGQQDPDYYPT